ncbi:hypothetical protein E2L08_12500 [Palleronia sediminis]|uniref:Uncharacterized protein n=1 Tax=Palleronia sediminis TaxID=2547833 RepID=A0A4R6AAI8_9RHOB|nr:hypothetical protein [Palleronia sediminis]TDL78113.1 hypothetical protein E2L08_12500 [Palleronia sediminis]
MQITLTDLGTTCALHAVTISSTTDFPLPTPADTLRDGLRAILAEPTKQNHTASNVLLVRRPTGIDVVSPVGSFLVPYPNLFPLV